MHLSKYHGLGNDFLVVLVDQPGAERLVAAAGSLAKAWCDRRRGIGADGLIIGEIAPVGADLRMHLHNADGGRAEISGNGIRCLAQAEIRRRGLTRGALRITTDAGDRQVLVSSGPSADTVLAEVDMGEVTTVSGMAAPAALAVSESSPSVALVDVGNPHVVIGVEDPAGVDLATLGARIEAEVPGGANVHVIAPVAGTPDALRVRTWERGAGLTEACGSGAVASAYAAHQWGVVGDDVIVHMPGGDARVRLGSTARLIGPATHIADIEIAATQVSGG
ncbi:MAG: diaminopimelate epimerase [Actinomycetota bacterium]|nr:diaminopimelate epimerase [Actinomycetota bacterium]